MLHLPLKVCSDIPCRFRVLQNAVIFIIGINTEPLDLLNAAILRINRELPTIREISMIGVVFTFGFFSEFESFSVGARTVFVVVIVFNYVDTGVNRLLEWRS